MKLSQAPAPIAVFDSGYGGLTVLKEIVRQLPKYDYIYLGDNARAPYGPRSFETVYEYTLQAVRKLFEMGSHLVILACNTASAKALRSIQQNNLPRIDPNRRVLGVIRPSVEAIGQHTNSKHVGVLGTYGTVRSESYPLEINKLHQHLHVHQQACPMWVPLVEYGEFDKPGADYFVRRDLNKLLEKSPEIDTIILACTHYPLLLPKISKHAPANVKIIAQGQIVAASLSDYLKRHPEMEKKCSKGNSRLFFTTENPEVFRSQAQVFCESDNMLVHKLHF